MENHFSNRWLGIDFSGNHKMWKPDHTKSNVWIADVRKTGEELYLYDIRPVQELPGHSDPFENLIALLSRGDFLSAAIDAPFSVPEIMFSGNHSELLYLAANLPHRNRPFAKGLDLMNAIIHDAGEYGTKVYRQTEKFWIKRKINVRSTLWAGPRGGAPMTVACLTLLYHASRPIWPWVSESKNGLIVEAFPAAQLFQWNLPHQNYAGDKQIDFENRSKILNTLKEKLEIPTYFEDILNKNADALDAVLCAFSAIAVIDNKLADSAFSGISNEGWIAVHQ